MKTKIKALSLIFAVSAISAQKKQQPIDNFIYGANDNCSVITLKFDKGKNHNHPLFAIWLADENGKFLQTLYVSQSIGRGVFEHGNRSTGRWMPGEIQRPAALPYWAHQRGIKNENGTFLPTPKNPELDARTGATPQNSFVMTFITEKPLKGKYKVMLELNQSWDWNDYWHNNRYPDDKEYKTSSQPALVYCADIDTNNKTEYVMKAIGHSHYSGKDGSLNTDLSTLSTALKIAEKITVLVQ